MAKKYQTRRTRLTAVGTARKAISKNKTKSPKTQVLVVSNGKRKSRKRENKKLVGVEGAYHSVVKVLNEPYTLILIGLALLVIVNYQNSKTENVVTKLADTIGNQTSLGIWMKANVAKVIGLAIMAPSVFTSPKSIRVPLAIGSLALVYLVRALSLWNYFSIAIAIRVFFKVKDQNIRLIVFGLAFAMYYIGAS